MSALPQHIEKIHLSLWRANQLSRSVGRTVPTDYDRLSQELPGGGWPVSALIELITPRYGIGEMQLMLPALKLASKRTIMFVQPHAVPDAPGYA